MTAAPPRSCAVCSTPLPADAVYCLRCGTRTPTQISEGGTQTLSEPVTPDILDTHRARLQHALGADYVVEELLGSGGFAQVWAAQDKRLHRRVAVKVLHPELVASQSLIERFQREAQAVARLRHPGIVPIYGVGQADGLAFYVMPLIEGQSLREALRHGPLPAAEARRIMREIAAALAVAHRAEIVHRDIKPENVMLDGEDRRVLVMDFGIAKSVEAGATAGLTGTGMIIGTPAYMSPEQATADKDIGPRSDVYSLGVVGFEMLTGRTPFDAGSAADLIVKQATTPAPSLAVVKADAPEDLVIAINRCLAKEPRDRWPHAGDLAVFLERQLTPTGAPAPVSKDLLKFAKKRRWRPTWKQTRIAILGAFAAAAVVTWFARRDLYYLAWDFWRGAGDPAEVAPAEPSQRGRAIVNRNWESRMFRLGADGLVILDFDNHLDGAHLWDGATWRSLRYPADMHVGIQADDAVLLFDANAMYRLTATGIVREVETPFPVAAGWARGRDILITSEEGDLAWRTSTGWQRQPVPRRVRLVNVFGPARDQLFVLGYFATGQAADSIVEYGGVSWESVSPHPGTGSEWIYDSGNLLPDGSILVGGRTGEREPLLLVREGGTWKRRELRAPPGFTIDIWGIEGPSADSLLVWDATICARDCLAEIHGSVITPVTALSRGGIRGVTWLRNTPHVLRSDGTIWARRSGRWVHAAEVPNLVVRYGAEFEEGRYRAWALAGDGYVNGSFQGDPNQDDRALLVPRLPVSRLRGVAIGHHRAWLLGNNGVVYDADCGGSPPCSAAPVAEFRDSVTALVPRRGGGAMAIGARGFIARTGIRGWQRLALPRGADAETLVTISEAPDSGFVVLGRRHVFAFNRSGDGRVLAQLPQSLRTASVIASNGREVMVATPDGKVALIDSVGHLTINTLYLLRSQERVTSLIAIDERRFVVGAAESTDDPYAAGRGVLLKKDPKGALFQQWPLSFDPESRTGLHVLSWDPAYRRINGIGVGSLRAYWLGDQLPFRDSTPN